MKYNNDGFDKEDILSDSKVKKSPYEIREPGKEYKTLDDLEGNLDTKEQLEELVSRISFPDLYTLHGVSIERGILLEGEPGNGKTFCIECIQGELAKNGQNFGVMEYSLGSYGSIYINKNSVAINDFFKAGQECLKTNSKIRGILYFFDEANSLMTSRSNSHQHKEDKKMLETLMMNMQQVHNRQTPEYMFFATNFKVELDEASIREGRIDKKITFDNPNADSRKSLFQKEINRINNKSGYAVLPKKVPDEIIDYSEGLSCIDCIQVIDKTVRSAIHEGVKEIKSNKSKEILIPHNIIKIKKGSMLEKVKEIKKDKNKKERTNIGFNPTKNYEAKSYTE